VELDTVQQTVRRRGQSLELSPTEYRILEYLIHRPRAVVSQQELLEHLYDFDWEHHSNVIEAHISNLRRKLNIAGAEPLIEPCGIADIVCGRRVLRCDGSISITRRLIVTVLVLELLSAVALIGAITVHERHMQLKAFDASLVATGESLMGAVQDTEDEADNVMLDMRGVQVAKNAAFRVEDERDRVLVRRVIRHVLKKPLSAAPAFHDTDVNGRAYRFLVMQALRIVDPVNRTAEFATASRSFTELRRSRLARGA